MVDGYFVRAIKSKEFLHHNPEFFALYASAAIILGCGTVFVMVMPIELHPLVLPCVPAGVRILTGLAVGSFHRLG